MSDPSCACPKVLLLYSDTGGGHRSAGKAIIQALKRAHGDCVRVELVDILKEVAPPPLNYLPDWYPYLVKVPPLWGLGYRIINSSRRANLAVNVAWPYVRRSVSSILLQHPSDLIVSLHPLANLPFLRAERRGDAHFVTVVTDLVSKHALWYHPEVDLCFVPTGMAAQRAIACGMSAEKILISGLPVTEDFRPLEDRRALRERLGWSVDSLVVLLMGGAEGFGPIEACARGIADSGLDVMLVVVTGRNEGLRRRLQAKIWSVPTYIYAFVEDMPSFMHAADILVTKAGPGTISEALNAGLPIILHSRLPGQEDGNVDYVVSSGAGVWAPGAERVISALRDWVENPGKRQAAAAACLRASRPGAARYIARRIGEMLHL